MAMHPFERASLSAGYVADVEALLATIDQARRDLQADARDERNGLHAREALDQARAVWGTLDREGRHQLSGPARELRALMERSGVHLGPPPTPEQLLQRYGLNTFRPGQRDAVQAALDGRDSLVVMPTGGGKSLCYQLPALADRGLVVVVSPLIALMADQLHRMQEVGVNATMLASGMQEGHNERALLDIRSGKAQLVLAAPERFASANFQRALSRRKVALFVVDEAHCVAEWGHDFRPDYLRLHGAIEALGKPPVMAATATATPRVAEEIAERLGLSQWEYIRSGFDRPNLSFDVVSVESLSTKARKQSVLLEILREPQSRPAIVYCGTRKDTETVAALLAARGFSSVGYHAGMTSGARQVSQAAFMDGSAEVVVATNAFGMGVHKSNVRTVAHWAIPKSLEAYYQEAGRAGRDGKPARALLLVSRSDLGRLVRFNNERKMTVADVTDYVSRLRARSRNSEVEVGRPEQEERMLLSVAERCGALRLQPGSNGDIRIRLTGRLNTRATQEAIQQARDRGWEAYKAIESFVSSTRCRRRQMLDFFGDPTPSAPEGRCCDVCDLEGAALLGHKRSVVSPSFGPSVDSMDFEKLTAWREERAEGKPVFVVATDSTLKEILKRRPGSTEALLRINGIGPWFCDKHGESLLQTLSVL
jgi:ATP-dependent DNA helicase RecQ